MGEFINIMNRNERKFERGDWRNGGERKKERKKERRRDKEKKGYIDREKG
jgi:hypothetical protein